MARDRLIGAALVVGAIIGVIIYFSLMFLLGREIAILVLEITAFVGVLAILAILGWIGYVMATTPPPVPLEPEPTTSTTPGSTSPGTSTATATQPSSSSEKH